MKRFVQYRKGKNTWKLKIHAFKDTHKVVRADKLCKERGSCPLKLLDDRSLHKNTSYQSIIKENVSYPSTAGKWKDCNYEEILTN